MNSQTSVALPRAVARYKLAERREKRAEQKLVRAETKIVKLTAQLITATEDHARSAGECHDWILLAADILRQAPQYAGKHPEIVQAIERLRPTNDKP